ncbi:MAG: hypothetical protein EON48_09110, partial [Acetobacteraceae bacterium]
MHATNRISNLKSIFFKLTAATVLLTAVVAGSLTFLNWRATEQMMEGLVRDRASQETIALAEEASGAIRFGRANKVYELFTALMRHSSGATRAAVAVDRDGKLIPDPTGAAAAAPELQD